MIDRVNISDCTLCKACSNICPSKCIEFNRKNNTFYYPTIDYDNCTKCERCEDVCPLLSPLKKGERLSRAFACYYDIDDVRSQSSSGGIFSALAEYVLEKNGLVAGARFDESWLVEHILVKDLNELQMLRGSKYVQSNMKDVYAEVKSLLKGGKEVLFSGCPCQVAGLKSFLNKNYENLLTVDFICHSIPSQEIFSRYIDVLEQKYKGEVTRFKFRNKDLGWKSSAVSVQFSNGKKYHNVITEDIYMRGFLGTVYSKEACLNCQFKNSDSNSDITLADFWGAEVFESDLIDNKGLSLMIVNSKKGLSVTESISEKIVIRETDFNNSVKYNQRYLSSANGSPFMNEFASLFESGNYKKAFMKYCKERNYKKALRVTRKVLGSLVRGLSFSK